jgi:hypothetical protein
VIKLKKLLNLLNEEHVGDFDDYEVYKNPKSIKRMKKELRGISHPNGDLFVIDDNWDIIHSQLAGWLNGNGYKTPSIQSKTGMATGMKKGYISWQRKGTSNDFWLSESTDFDDKVFDEEELMPYIKKYTKKVKQKNSQYNFILKSI